MEHDVFMKALWATARVACASAIVGCQHSGNLGTCQPGPTDTGGNTATSDSANNDSLATSETGLPGDSCAAPSNVEECMDELRTNFRNNKATKDCCQAVAEYYDAANLEGLESWDTRNECCELLEWQGSLACTPWGPPRPPSKKTFSRITTELKVRTIRRAALA